MEFPEGSIGAANGIWSKQQEEYIKTESFASRLKRASEQGLLLFIKYALVLILAYFALLFVTNVVNGSQNGTQSALYLQQLQLKGWLPKVNPDGSIPMKEQNATPSK